MTNICYDRPMGDESLPTVGSWLLRKLSQRELDEGRRYTIAEYAKLLGISRPYLTMLINGEKKGISRQKANQIAQRLQDYEILDILGYARPEAEDLLSEFPSEFRDPLLAALSAARSELVNKGITTNSPEFEEIIRIVFAKFGVEIKVTKK